MHAGIYPYTDDLTDVAAARMLVQSLANLITQNEENAQALWTRYMDLPQEQSILVYVAYVFHDQVKCG